MFYIFFSLNRYSRFIDLFLRQFKLRLKGAETSPKPSLHEKQLKHHLTVTSIHFLASLQISQNKTAKSLFYIRPNICKL